MAEITSFNQTDSIRNKGFSAQVLLDSAVLCLECLRKGPLLICGCPPYWQKMPWYCILLFAFPQHRQMAKYEPRTTLLHNHREQYMTAFFVFNFKIESDVKIHDTVEKQIFLLLKKWFNPPTPQIGSDVISYFGPLPSSSKANKSFTPSVEEL